MKDRLHEIVLYAACFRRALLSPKTFRIAISTVLCALTLALAASQLNAQGCAMCYQNTSASGEAGRAALRHGILVLLVPAAALFGGALALIYRRRDPTADRRS